MARVDNTGGPNFSVDNGTGLQVRSKINEVIAALKTLNQGAGIPNTTEGKAAYVPFIDGDILKIFGSNGEDVITLGDVSKTNFDHAGLAIENTFSAKQVFNKSIGAGIEPLDDGVNITIDFRASCLFSLTLQGTRTLKNPTHTVVGQSGSIFLTQDTNGYRGLIYESHFKFPSGQAPDLTVTQGSVDRLDYIIKSSDEIHCVITKNLKAT